MIGEYLESIPMPRQEREAPPFIWILESDTESAYSLLQQLESFNYGVQLFSHTDLLRIALQTKQPHICIVNSFDALGQGEKVNTVVNTSASVEK